MTLSIPTITSLGFDTTSQYQEFHGLLPDNVLGPITQKSLSIPRCCSRPDIENYTLPQNNNQLRKWPHNDLHVYPKDNIAPFSITETNDILISALQAWADVANLNFTLTTSRAHITVTAGRIDGPSGTLAWSELPNQSGHVLQKYDSTEQWVHSSNPPNSKIDLLAVMVHELGHALGLGHAPATASATNIMAPFYSPSIREPLQGDIERIQNLYGPPLETPTPTPTPNPDPDPNDPIPAQGKLLVSAIHFTKDGLVLDISELPDPPPTT